MQSTVCDIIKLFTTRKSCPGKASDQNEKLTDREVRLFSRYIFKNRHLTVPDKVKWAKESFGKIISEAAMS